MVGGTAVGSYGLGRLVEVIISATKLTGISNWLLKQLTVLALDSKNSEKEVRTCEPRNYLIKRIKCELFTNTITDNKYIQLPTNQ